MVRAPDLGIGAAAYLFFKHIFANALAGVQHPSPQKNEK
jgi:hypothetical protein